MTIYFCEDVLRWLADVGQLRCLAQLAPAALGEGKCLFPDQIKLRVRFSLDNMKLDDDVLNIPLFMADHGDRLIGLALERREG